MSQCKFCHKEIDWIKTRNLNPMPVNPGLVKADGNRVLVFPDGSVGRTHEEYDEGMESHFANCEPYQKQRKEALDKMKHPGQGKLF